MTKEIGLWAASMGAAFILLQGIGEGAGIGPREHVSPLFAALRGGYGATVRTLTGEGSDVNLVNAEGETPLMYAAMYSDAFAIARILDRRADPNAKTPAGTTALMLATGDLAKTKLLVEHGAEVNARSVTGRTALLIAASRSGSGKVVEYLLAHGADANAKDDLQGMSVIPAGAGGSTPLIEAAKIRDGQALRALLAVSADIQAKDRSGADALAAAALHGNLDNVRLLLANGAKNDAPAATAADRTDEHAALPDVREAVTRSVALLQKSGPEFFKVSGCVSCHNQSLPQMTLAMARARDIHVDEAVAAQQRKAVMGVIRPARLPLLEMSDVVPDIAGTAGYLMLGLSAEGVAPDAGTDAVALNLAAKQFPDGSWRPWGPRPPLEFSAVTSTALSVRVLQLYGPPARRAEFDDQIAAARRWLRRVAARTNEERAMRLLGLAWTKAPQVEIDRAAWELRLDQREDGGWSQLPMLGSDAYATGQAIYALRTAGGLKTNEGTYRRGAAYLLSTQEQDGSWRVASRSFPLQVYEESGFPHGKDQWISAAGTSWAAMALMQGI